MEEKELEAVKEEFINIYKQFITRDGADKFLDWLIKTDFFIAPASTKFHSAFEGGLCKHSINAYKRFKDKYVFLCRTWIFHDW